LTTPPWRANNALKFNAFESTMLERALAIVFAVVGAPV
jgi:hypothetical protein